MNRVLLLALIHSIKFDLGTNQEFCIKKDIQYLRKLKETK